MRGRMSGAYITSEHYVDAMIHFVHPWRKWLILSQKSAESISGLVVTTSERVSVSGVCQEDAAILASCRNYFL